MAYRFGRRLTLELGVPVRLIQTAYGGSKVAPFTPLSGLRGHPLLEGQVAEVQAVNEMWQARQAAAGPLSAEDVRALHPFAALDDWNTLTPDSVWNVMIGLLLPFSLRGALWY